MTTNDGGPAFSGFEMVDDELMVCGPDGVTKTVATGTKSPRWVQGRLTVLDYFAAAALPDLHRVRSEQARALFEEIGSHLSDKDSLDFVLAIFKGTAEASYALADAMLAERERRAAP